MKTTDVLKLYLCIIVSQEKQDKETSLNLWIQL